MQLNALQEDAIKELFNRSIGRAAEIISQMTDRSIKLSVPKILPADSPEKSYELRSILGVKQQFQGNTDGFAYLLYNDRGSMDLIAAVLNVDVPPEELGDIERESLLEIGNIIISSCFFEFSCLFGKYFFSKEPELVKTDSAHEPFNCDESKMESLRLSMDFTLAGSSSKGEITFVLNSDSLKDIREQIDQYISSILAA